MDNMNVYYRITNKKTGKSWDARGLTNFFRLAEGLLLDPDKMLRCGVDIGRGYVTYSLTTRVIGTKKVA